MNADSSRAPPPLPLPEPFVLVLVPPYPTTPAPALTTPPTPFFTTPPTPARADVRLRVEVRRYAPLESGEGPGLAEDEVLTRGVGVDGDTGFDTDTGRLCPFIPPVVSIGARDGRGAAGPFTVSTLLAIGSSSSLDVLALSPSPSAEAIDSDGVGNSPAGLASDPVVWLVRCKGCFLCHLPQPPSPPPTLPPRIAPIQGCPNPSLPPVQVTSNGSLIPR